MQSKRWYEEAEKRYSYDLETGEVRNRKTGKMVGEKQKGKYYMLGFRLNKKMENNQLHRFAWYCVNGHLPEGMEIDHINGDTHDNRAKNLRLVTKAENQRNRHTHRKGRLCGTYWHKPGKRWAAQVHFEGRMKHLGLFDTESDAHEAWKSAIAYIEREGKFDEAGKRKATIQA